MSVAVIHGTKGAGLAGLAKRIGELGQKRVLIGVPKGAPDIDGESMALRLARLEFGTSTSSERPVLRGGIRAAFPKLKVLNERLLRGVLNGTMGETYALDLLGMSAAGEIKKYMTGPNFAPNAPSTIAKKGSSQPTIDSGALRQHITHVVEGA